MSDFPTFSAMSSLPELTLVAWTHAGEGYPTSSPVPTPPILACMGKEEEIPDDCKSYRIPRPDWGARGGYQCLYSSSVPPGVVGREVDFGQGVKAIVCPYLTTCKVIPSAKQGAVHSHKRCVKQRGVVNSSRKSFVLSTLHTYLLDCCREEGELKEQALRWLAYQEDIGDKALMEHLSKRIKAERPGEVFHGERKAPR
jgi:hypothetical protein